MIHMPDPVSCGRDARTTIRGSCNGHCGAGVPPAQNGWSFMFSRSGCTANVLRPRRKVSLLQHSTDAIRLTGGETEGGPRPTLRRTHNLRWMVGWALAHLQSRSHIFGVSERPNRVKRKVLQEAQA